MKKSVPGDAALAALDELEIVLRETTKLYQAVIRRVNFIRRLRNRGYSYSEIIPMEKRPLIVELLTQALSDLSEAGSRFRKTEARALQSEGLTMAQIAELFGVTRQRVAVLLQPPSGSAPEQPLRRRP